ncbi:hypothetical protein SAMN05444147_11625 [Pectobacterium carotovorum]|nr:hypothetical protein SAMN05444147_11625 [Pectobacterium carotovorum]
MITYTVNMVYLQYVYDNVFTVLLRCILFM